MDSGFRVLDSGLVQWNLDSGFHSLSCIPDSKAQDHLDFNEQNFPEFRNLQVKIFSDSGIRIPLHGRIQGRGPGGPPPYFRYF